MISEYTSSSEGKSFHLLSEWTTSEPFSPPHPIRSTWTTTNQQPTNNQPTGSAMTHWTVVGNARNQPELNGRLTNGLAY